MKRRLVETRSPSAPKASKPAQAPPM